MFFLHFLLTFRFKNPTGEFLYIPKIQDNEFIHTLQSNNRSIIVFQDNPYLLDFMNFAIFKYKKEILFAQANFDLSKMYHGCTQEPCILAFEYDKQIMAEPHPYYQLGFALWVQNLFSGGVTQIKNLEQFQKFLDSDESRLIGVDVDERPSVPKDIVFYTVKSSFLEKFNVYGLQKGIYTYKKNERLFLPYEGGDVKSQSQSYFIDIEKLENVKLNQYLCGYIISNDYDLSRELEAIEKVIPKHLSKVSFTISSEKKASYIVSQAKLKKAEVPYFFVVKSENFSTGKWLVLDERRYDSDYLDQFLTNIEEEKEPFTYISATVHNNPDSTFKQINRNMYHDAISDDKNDVLLVITAPWCHHCKDFKPVLNVTSRLLHENNVNAKFYWIDGTLNELPDDFPEFSGYPTLFMFPSNNKTAITFDGDRTIPGILDFLHVNGTMTFTDPVYDHTKIDDEIEKLREEQHSL